MHSYTTKTLKNTGIYDGGFPYLGKNSGMVHIAVEKGGKDNVYESTHILADLLDGWLHCI